MLRVGRLATFFRWDAATSRALGISGLDGRENGYCESFNGRIRVELLNGDIFYSLREALVLIERWRNHYNTKRPHSVLGHPPPAPETTIPVDQRPVMQ